MAALARETKTVLNEIAAEDDLSKRIYESFRKSLKLSQAWSRIGDEAFLAARRELFSL